MEHLWTYAWIGLAGGAAAFAHCLGMCGGFALHLAKGETRRGALVRQLLWHAGKTTTYVFLGALAGLLGGWIGSAAPWLWMQDALAYLTGGVMVLAGLAMFGLIPARIGRRDKEGDGLVSSLLRQFFGLPTPAAALVLGLATGFLPCPIVMGMLALSVQSGSVAVGMAVMAAMGAGTVWSLLVLGMTGHMVTLRLRRWGTAVAAAVLILLGVATALRGTEVLHRVLGCPPAPAAAEPAERPCCHSH